MRLLCVDNGPVISRGSARLLNRHSARFYCELAELFPGLTLAQGLVDLGEQDSLADFDLAQEPSIQLEVLPWRTAGIGRLLSYIRAVPWAFRLVRRSDHLYLFFGGHLPLLFAVIARLLGRPYGVYLRGSLTIDSCRMRKALSGARFVIASTDTLRDHVHELCPDAATVTPMIDVRRDQIAERTEFRDSGPWRLLFVGRVEKRKGVGELLSAVPQLRERAIPFSLQIAGGGPELDVYRTRVEREGLSEVRFLGVVSDPAELARLYRDSDLFVFPSHTEGFPRVLYEAMANGLPALTTFVGGIPAIMKDGVNCLRIDVQDAADVAEKIAEALGDVGLRRRLSIGGTTTMRDVLAGQRPSHARQVAERIRL